jgi:hypothetical protein
MQRTAPRNFELSSIHLSAFVRAAVLCAGAVLPAAIPAVAVQQAHAQMSMTFSRPEEAYRSSVSRADLRVMKRVLRLSNTEFEALQELHGAFVEGLRERAREISDKQLDIVAEMQAMQTMRPSDQSVNDDEAWKKDARERERAFVEDIRSLLSKEQEAHWDTLQRELRRMRERDLGRLMGEQIDLVQMVHDTVPDAMERQEVIDVLDAYATQIDAAYAKRREIVMKNKEAMGWDAKDKDEARAKFAELTAARVAIQEINLRTLPQLVAALPSQQAEKLDEAFVQAMYAKLMQPTHAEQIIRAAVNSAGMSSETERAMEEEVRLYDERKMAHIRKLGKLEMLAERERLPQHLRSSLKSAAGEDGTIFTFTTGEEQKIEETSELAKVRKERVGIDAQTRRSVMALLTNDQRARAMEGIKPTVMIGSTDDWKLTNFSDFD